MSCRFEPRISNWFLSMLEKGHRVRVLDQVKRHAGRRGIVVEVNGDEIGCALDVCDRLVWFKLSELERYTPRHRPFANAETR